jgi:hypothetical protein
LRISLWYATPYAPNESEFLNRTDGYAGIRDDCHLAAQIKSQNIIGNSPLRRSSSMATVIGRHALGGAHRISVSAEVVGVCGQRAATVAQDAENAGRRVPNSIR